MKAELRGHSFGVFEVGGNVWMTSSTPPRMPGTGCGCRRIRGNRGEWILELCDRHVAEFRARREAFLELVRG